MLPLTREHFELALADFTPPSREAQRVQQARRDGGANGGSVLDAAAAGLTVQQLASFLRMLSVPRNGGGGGGEEDAAGDGHQ